MLGDIQLREQLNAFAKYVIQQSRTNLTKSGKKATGELYKSLNSKLIESSGSLVSLIFKMVDYGEFIDRGVSGKEKKFGTKQS